MTALVIIWIISIAVPLAVLSGKWLSMCGWRIPLVRTLTSTTKPLDNALHEAKKKLSGRVVDARHAALLKFHHFVYDDFIPWAQRRYRTIASYVYRFHRRLWSTLEYSRYSSHKVSDYLKQLSHEKEQGQKRTEVKSSAAEAVSKADASEKETVQTAPEEKKEESVPGAQ